MDGTGAPPSEPVKGDQESLLPDEDVVTKLQQGQAVQNDVREALARLASALSSASDNDTIIRTVKHRFDERKEARADLWRVTEEARADKERRDSLNKAQADRESALQNEVGRLERAVKIAGKTCTDTQREGERAAAAAEKEISRLRDKSSSAEKDAATWQQRANAGELRLESMTAEVSALHEAMAGLHGEMGAVQRELDGAKTSQDKLAADLSRAEGRYRKSQEACSSTIAKAKDAEKRLRKETEERERVSAELETLVQVSKEEKTKILTLTAEIKRLKESEGVHRSGSDKLNATNRELNALLQRLSTDLEEAKAAGESSGKQAEALAHEVGLKEGEVQRVREALAATEARLAASGRDKESLKEALSKSSAEAHAKTAEFDRQRGELDLLEREKHDLVLDVQERVRVQKEATTDAERYRERLEQAENRLKEGESATLAAELSRKKTLDELGEARRGTVMQDERIEALRSELTTIRRTLEQTTEAAKARDRESAQRLVQLSQANAKLSSESTSARARVIDAEEAVEKAEHNAQEAAKAQAKLEDDGRRAAESVQRLEEELEIANARWKAAQGQLVAANRREKEFAEEARRRMREALESKDKEKVTALREIETHAERRFMEAEARHRAVERNHGKALAAIREDAKKKLLEEESRRVREVSDARKTSKAVVEALQTLQGELTQSEAKGSGLERQVSQLSARMSRAGSSSVAPAGGSGGDGSSASGNGGVGVERDGRGSSGARGAEVAEAEITSLRRQMKAATEAKETAQRSALEARLRADEETKRRSSLEESLCRKESDVLAALERLNQLKIRQKANDFSPNSFHSLPLATEVEEHAREGEEDLRSLVRQRESEIESLTRRNQILNEALSRLTSADSYPADVTTAGSLSAVSAISAGGRAEGFPAIPKLVDRGRELAASLRADSWQTGSASSFSPTLQEGAGNSLLGLEASLSVLANGSTGFEPPAPPTVETDADFSRQDHRAKGRGTELRMDGSSNLNDGDHDQAGTSVEDERNGRDNGTSTRGGGVPPTQEPLGRNVPGEGAEHRHHGNAIATSSAKNNLSAYEYPAAADKAVEVRPRAAIASADRCSNGGAGVLHGVPAAMASGALALPPAAVPAPALNRDRLGSGSDHKYDTGDGHRAPSDYLPHLSGGGTRDGGGRRKNESSQSTSHTGSGAHGCGNISDVRSRAVADGRVDGNDGAVGDSVGQDQAQKRNADDGGEQSRRHIDEALRNRALRRTKSDEEMPEHPENQGLSSRRARSGHNGSTTTVANFDFPAWVRSEFRGSAGMTNSSSSNTVGYGGEAARFINLDSLAQRATGGSKQGLPGRGGDVRVTRARSIGSTPKGTIVATGGVKRNSSSSRVYGIPQNSR
ncbi:unnamed protein product [Ectocarpus sp. 12 AP-2014]